MSQEIREKCSIMPSKLDMEAGEEQKILLELKMEYVEGLLTFLDRNCLFTSHREIFIIDYIRMMINERMKESGY
jgi:hypothetical protein